MALYYYSVMSFKSKISIKYSGQTEPILLKRQLKENRVEVDRYITLRHRQ